MAAEAESQDDRPEWRRLYDEAYARFGLRALWSYQPRVDATPRSALQLCYSLRTQGNMAARRLAERLEAACRAAE